MLDQTQWRLRGTRLYGIRGDRSPLTLCRDLTSQLVRVDVVFKNLKSTWYKAGTIQQVSDGIRAAEKTVPFESRYYLFPTDLAPTYSLYWQPVPWLPVGRLQVWEYIGLIPDALLHQLANFSGESQMPVITNPVARAATSRDTDKGVSTTSVVLMPAELRRVGGTIINRSTIASLSINFGETATAADYHRLTPGGSIDIPISWVGAIAGIWDKADPLGKAVMTELLG